MILSLWSMLGSTKRTSWRDARVISIYCKEALKLHNGFIPSWTIIFCVMIEKIGGQRSTEAISENNSFKYFTVIAICNRYLAFLLPVSANLSKQFTIQIKGWLKLPLWLRALLCSILKTNNRR